MAFENVFSNVNYGMIPQARQQEASRLQQMIGQGIAMGERAQDRELKSRQLANKKEPMEERDFEMVQRFQAGDRSPDVINHLQARAAMEGEKTKYTADPFNAGTLRAATTPNQFAQLMGVHPQTQNQYGAGADGQTYDANVPVQDQAPLMGAGQMAAQPSDLQQIAGGQMPNALDEYALPQTDRYSGSTTEELAVGKEKTRLGGLVGQKRIEAAFAEEKAQKALAAKKKAGRPAMLAEHSIMFDDISQALDILNDDKGFLPKTGTIGSVLDYFPETEAGRLSTKLFSVQNLVAFGKMAQMREASPTGSTGLGALSTSEMDSLKSTSGNISIKQRKKDLDYNLKRLQNQQMDLVHGTPAHIAKVGKELGLQQSEIDSLSFRYDLSKKAPKGKKPSGAALQAEMLRRGLNID